MRGMWAAFGEVAKYGRWLITLLGVVAGIATFMLAGHVVTLYFVIFFLLVLLGLTLHLLGKRLPPLGMPVPAAAQESQALSTHGTATPSEESAAPEGETSSAVEAAGATDERGDDKEESKSLDLAVQAAVAGDLALAREHVRNFVDSSVDASEKSRNLAYGELVLFKAGDAGALSRLAGMVDAEKEPRAKILRYYAAALEMSAGSATAVAVLRAKSSDLNAAHKADAMLQCAEILLRSRNPQEAQDVASPLASDESLPARTRAQAWVVLAEAQKELAPITAALAYEKALAMDPSLSGARFDLALLYSSLGQYLLSRLHYRALIGTNRSRAVSLNNIGVASERLGLRITAFDSYEDAAEAGNALAYGNMANHYVGIGARRQAARAIEDGAAIAPNEPQVVSARHALADQVERERKLVDDYNRLADTMHSTVVETEWATPVEDLSGPWMSESSLRLEIVSEGNGVFVGESEKLTIRLESVVGGYKATTQAGKYASAIEGLMLPVRNGLVLYPHAPETARCVDVQRFERVLTKGGGDAPLVVES